MDLKIDVVKGHGDEKTERVLLSVLKDCDLKYYMISDATYTKDNKISNKHRHSKWFSPKAVEKGDKVILYTRAGKNVTVTGDDGVVWHKIFWGMNSPVWNDKGDAAILIKLSAWNTTRTR
jgi:hypothetical protein